MEILEYLYYQYLWFLQAGYMTVLQPLSGIPQTLTPVYGLNSEKLTKLEENPAFRVIEC